MARSTSVRGPLTADNWMEYDGRQAPKDSDVEWENSVVSPLAALLATVQVGLGEAPVLQTELSPRGLGSRAEEGASPQGRSRRCVSGAGVPAP